MEKPLVPAELVQKYGTIRRPELESPEPPPRVYSSYGYAKRADYDRPLLRQSPEEPERDEVELRGPGGMSFRARGYDFITIILLLLMAGIGVAFYFHMVDTAEKQQAMIRALERSAQAQEKALERNAEAQEGQTKTLRWLGCILATDTERRSSEYAYHGSRCNREL
jgi:hypothetical protein